jgi:HK97 family phage prohead protease
MAETKNVYPGPGEKRENFIARCMVHYMRSGRPRAQAAAICFDAWRRGKALNDSIVVLRGTVSKGEDGIYHGIASTADEDRDNEIILPSSFKNLDTVVKEQAPMYFQHAWRTSGPADETKMPVGKIVAAAQSPTDLQIRWIFAAGGPMTFAPKVQWMVDHGFLKYLSICATPIKWETDKQGRRVYTEMELLEVSVVGIPSNRGAIILNEMKVAGFAISKDEEKLLFETDADQPDGGVADKVEIGNWTKVLAQVARSTK